MSTHPAISHPNIQFLLQRRSVGLLQEPGPSSTEIEQLLTVAVSAPDHKKLAPWHFIVCQHTGLARLGEILQAGARHEEMDESAIERAAQLPNRAPTVIVCICQYQAVPGVPREEQIAATACATNNIHLAARALGYDGIWRTGAFAQNSVVKSKLGCNEDDEIVGFLYLGTARQSPPSRELRSFDSQVTFWS